MTEYLPDLSSFSQYVPSAWNLEIDRRGFYVAISCLVAVYFCGRNWILSEKNFNAPHVGRPAGWIPPWLLRSANLVDARSLINEGYGKYKNQIFKVARNNTDLLVIPIRYLEELRSLPREKISGTEAQIRNFALEGATGDSTISDTLHVADSIVRLRLNPRLGTVVSDIASELDYAMQMEMPGGLEDWSQVATYPILLRIMARMVAKIFVGEPTCRNEEWLKTMTEYTENLRDAGVILSWFPKFSHPVVARLLPAHRRAMANIQTAMEILDPKVSQRRAAGAQDGNDYRRPEDMFQWLMDTANSEVKLANYHLFLALASMHTTAMAIFQALFDLIEHPECVEPIRKEIFDVWRTTEDGKLEKSTPDAMHKLDSFIKESQRFNPPAILAFNRIVLSPVTLSNGVTFPVNTHLAAPADAIGHDSEYLESPSTFDGFRYARKRENPGEENRHQHASADIHNLHFSYGKYACPGRFLASLNIKLILARLLMEYEFDLPPGTSRPPNMVSYHLVAPDFSAKMMLRRKKDREGSE